MGAPGSLAVNGDEGVAVWPEGANPALKAAAEQERVDAVDEGAQPALAGDAVVEGGEAAQNGEVVLPPSDDVVEVIAGGDGRAGDQQQHLMEGVEHTPGLAGIVEGGEFLQQQAQAVARHVLAGVGLAEVGVRVEGAVGTGGMIELRAGSKPARNHPAQLTASNMPISAVHPNSKPWPSRGGRWT